MCHAVELQVDHFFGLWPIQAGGRYRGRCGHDLGSTLGLPKRIAQQGQACYPLGHRPEKQVTGQQPLQGMKAGFSQRLNQIAGEARVIGGSFAWRGQQGYFILKMRLSVSRPNWQQRCA